MGGQALRVDDIDGWRWLAQLEIACTENVQSRGVSLARDSANNVSENIADQSHSSSPSLSPKDGAGDGQMYYPTNGRNLGTQDRAKISQDPVAGPALVTVCTDALQFEYHNRKSAIKDIANDAGSNENTARNWWRARNLPDLVNAVNLSKEAPTLAARLVQQMASHKNIFSLLGELHRLAVMEAASDPDFAIEYGAFLQRHVIGRVG